MKATDAINTKSLAWVTAIVSVIAFGVIFMGFGRDFSNPMDLLKTVPMVITVDLFFWEVLRRWGWRWKPLRPWLIKVPDLNGEWQGVVLPNGILGASATVASAIPATMSIRQSLTSISCVVRTAEMKSTSFVAGFRMDHDEHLAEFSYSYQSVPRASVRQRSAPHFGTALLEFHDESPVRLTGEYWTTRESAGELEFKRISPRATKASGADDATSATEPN